MPIARHSAWFVPRFVALGAASGVLAGAASFVFLEALDRVTVWRVDHGWLVWLLPVAGLAIGLGYHTLGGRASGGQRWPSARRTRTLRAHVQMSSSLTDAAARALRLDHVHRATLARAALAGGFGSATTSPRALGARRFVAGATLGSVLAVPLQVSGASLAGIGLVAVFSAAAHVPLTGAVMAVELFGGGVAFPALLCCLVARVIAGGDGI